MNHCVPLIHQPFHDHGPVCVPTQFPSRGELVTVRVWIPHSWSAQSVTLRQVCDGEPRVQVASVGAREGAGQWYEASVHAHNPLTRYRFLITGEDAPLPYAWLNAAGLMDHDVSDACDFTLMTHEPAPQWVRDGIAYQIFPDRFARSHRAGDIREVPLPPWARAMRWDEPVSVDGTINGQQVYGGDLDGIRERLDYIQSLGVSIIYLCPIFPAGSAHRYDATSFTHVDPLLGGDAALEALSAEIHRRSMRLVLDLTTNHTGAHHEWFVTAQGDEGSEEAGFYFFNAHPDDYASWLGIPSLPKLDHSNAKLRERMYEGEDSVVRRWLADPIRADGWRIDVANMTGRYGAQDLAHEVARSIRSRMGSDTWLVAEHFHDASRDLDGDGWHGAMNYAGFTRPLWAWLAHEDTDVTWLGLPITVPRLSTGAVLNTLRHYNAHVPWRARTQSQNQLDSHDTPRFRTVVADPDRHAAALGALIGLPGVPTLFAGDELALEACNGEHARTPMPWEHIDATSLPQHHQHWLDLTREALRARKQCEALRRGGLRFVHESSDSFTWLRTHPSAPVLVHVARSAHDAIDLDEDALLASLNAQAQPAFVAGDLTVAAHGGCVRITARGAGAIIVPLTTLVSPQ